ncbi:MltR family transcriptional regulator [Exercitatus varius]|uniref:MltR family transcriptional regulator n=1 Tax=Exercitatus varius TaxID=67857 RepID=UPI00294B4E6C|nr:MltR family transcriptional regulator [Exercitatus varius]
MYEKRSEALFVRGIKNKRNDNVQKYRFSDNLIVVFIRKLRLFNEKSMSPPHETIEAPDSLVGQMKVRRREKLVQSCLILTVTEIYQQLQVESPW